MIRLDKYLCDMGLGTRSEVKQLLRKGTVTVNGTVVIKPDTKVEEKKDQVCLAGIPVIYEKYQYFMLYKPAGVVSATKDAVSETVLELLGNPCCKNLFPVGRLDKDTEGLLLITNDGALAHELLSPKKHVDKTYLVQTAYPVDQSAVQQLETGVEIGEEKPTLPAKVELLKERELLLTIHEGKFHQVKRMLQAVGNEVIFLKRLSMGSLSLDPTLRPGQYRTLGPGEIRLLKTPDVLQNVEAVLFDLDGTLVDSMWMWYDIDVEYLAKFGLSCPDDLQSSIEGMCFNETAVYFKERFSLPDSTEQIKADWNAMAWDKYLRQVPLKEGVAAFLEKCRSRGISMGIATSNSRELVRNIVSVHGLDRYISAIVTGSDVERGKPAPDIYLSVAEALKVAPEKCLVFEDIVPGIQAGKNAGMKVCAVEDAYSLEQRNEKMELADYYINSFRGI